MARPARQHGFCTQLCMSDIRFQSIEDGDLADIWYALAGSAARHPDHFEKLMNACFQELLDRRDVLREVVDTGAAGPAQYCRDDRVAAGRPADAQVDPARGVRLQEGELLGHDQRLVVGEHHPAGADP